MRKGYITVIILSFCGMSVEMVASRIMAPFFGTSLFVWACIIGVVLGFGSLGSFLGGRVADKCKDENKAVGNIVLAAAVCVILIAVTKNLFLLLSSFGGIVLAFFVSVILFAPISTVLCMATPIVIKKAVARGGAVGAISNRRGGLPLLRSASAAAPAEFMRFPRWAVSRAFL